MYEHMDFKLCIILFIYFQNVISYKIYQLDSDEGNEVLPKIRQLILDQRTNEVGHLNPTNVERQHPQPKSFGNSVFVKRVIPHNYETGEYEYDPQLNTLFKPLNRFHVNKPVKEQGFQIESMQNPKNKPEKDLIVLVQKEQDQKALVRQIQKYLDQSVREKNNRLKKNKKRFRGLLSRLDKEDLLFLRQLGKSAEQYDPLAPRQPKLSEMLPKSNSLETTEKTPIAEYPFWNYWTYTKTLQVDRCPGHLIQVGNMCVNSLGHRRAEILPNTRRNSIKKRHSMRAARKRHLYGLKK